jgi:hypothetical protein
MGLAEHNAKRRAEKAAKAAAMAAAGAAPEHKRHLTVAGVPLTDEQILALPYRYTDQGKAEAEAADAASGINDYPRVSISSDAWDKTLNKFEESPDLDPTRSFEPWEQTNPVEAAKAMARDANAFHFHLGHHSVIAKNGSRGFVPAEDKDGKPIMLGDLQLQKMPKERWNRREKHYQELAKTQVSDVISANIEAQERHLRKVGASKHAQILREGESVEDQQIGVQTVVGNQNHY